VGFFPGHQFTVKNKTWANRMKTTPVSMISAVKRAHACQSRGAAGVQKKLDSARIETLSMHSALLHALAQEMVANTPVPQAKIAERFINAWESGSDHIDMELQGALMDQVEDCRAH